MSKRIVGFLLAFCVVLTLLPIPVFADEVAEVVRDIAQTEDAPECETLGEPVALAAEATEESKAADALIASNGESNLEESLAISSMGQNDKSQDFAELLAATNGKYNWPIDTQYGITTGMYYSTGKYHGGSDFSGVDIAGKPIYSTAAGTVITAIDRGCQGSHNSRAPDSLQCPLGADCGAWKNNGTNGSYGNYIVIDHGNDVYSLYGHLKTGSFKVNVGDKVKQGQHIASCGTAGNSTGYHLHFELRIGENKFSSDYCVDPRNYLTEQLVIASGKPDAPTITKTTAESTTAITVTWDKVDGAEKYSLWWRIASGTWTEIPDLTGTSKKVTGLGAAQRYNFYVVAHNSAGSSEKSDTVMSYTLNNAPTIERISDTSLKLTWDKPKNAVSYVIWRKKHDGTYKEIKSGVTEREYTDTGLKAGTRYYYYVVSSNATNSTTYPNCASKERAYSTYMSAPTLTVNGQNSITLEWKQNSSDATYDNFEIYRKANNTGGFEKIDSVKWAKTSYIDKGLVENTTYEYYVKATGDGYSVPSLTSKAVTDAKPTITQTTADSTTAITVTWDKVGSATKYSLWWRIASGTWTEIPDLTGTSKKVTGLEAAQRYNFYVVAHNSTGSSEKSDTVMSYTLNNAPTIERISDTSLKLTWDMPKNAQSYAIWRRKHDGSYKEIKSGVTEREYTDTGLKAGTRYYYYVVSSNATNSTTYPDCTSKERAYSTYMAAPVLTVNGQNSITLEWKQNSSDATYDNFEIYRKADNTGDFEKIDSVKWDKTSYADKGLAENTTYEYYVKLSATDILCHP